jgi:UPF0176 protein
MSTPPLLPLPAAAPPLCHDSFYRFAALGDEAQVAQAVHTLRHLTGGLTGCILVAQEGVNAMLAGPATQLDAFYAALADAPLLGPLMRDLPIKRSHCVTPPFRRMKVHHRAEILPLGVPGVNAIGHVGQALSPAQWREMLDRDDLVLIDNRNSFEFRLGRFRGAIDPQVHHFRDFPVWVEAQLPRWKAEGKTVAMYCTGGIRCEKSSAWLETLGLPVLQLDGGILNYFAQLPDAERDWQGECFVFDNRTALDTRLQETGTTPEQVYASGDADDAWRLARARRLAEAAARGDDPHDP